MAKSFSQNFSFKKILKFLLENLPIDPAIENWIRARGGHCEKVSEEEGEVVVRPTVHLMMIVRIMVIMIMIVVMVIIVMMVSQEEGEVVVWPGHGNGDEGQKSRMYQYSF